MKPSTSVNTFLYLILTLIVITSVGCGPDFGQKYAVNSTEIYYKDGATLADAQRLGKQLEKMKFVDGKSKSVQLTKRGDVWEFRLATKTGVQDDGGENLLKLYGLELSSAFDGDEFEIHICNQKLESKSIVKGLRGKVYRLGKNSYFYRGIELEQVKKFAAIAWGTDLDTSTGFSYHLSQPASVVEIRMAHPNLAKDDKRLAVAARDSAVAASSIFGGKQVDVLLCNAYFDTQNSYSSTQKAATLTP